MKEHCGHVDKRNHCKECNWLVLYLSMCVHTCERLEVLLSCFLPYLLIYFLRQGFSWTWSSLIRLAGSSRDPHSSAFPVLGLYMYTTFPWMLGLELGPSCLCFRYLTCWVSSFASLLYFWRLALDSGIFLLQPPECWDYKHATTPSDVFVFK